MGSAEDLALQVSACEVTDAVGTLNAGKDIVEAT